MIIADRTQDLPRHANNTFTFSTKWILWSIVEYYFVQS